MPIDRPRAAKRQSPRLYALALSSSSSSSSEMPTTSSSPSPSTGRRGRKARSTAADGAAPKRKRSTSTARSDSKAGTSKRKGKNSRSASGCAEQSTTATTTDSQGDDTSTNKEDNTLLLDMGALIEGAVVKRPSSTIKSPYVADVRLTSSSTEEPHEDDDEPLALAHAPALDVGGMCAPGKTVFMKERPPGGKTSHSIELVLAPGPDGRQGTVLVGAHPRLGEVLAEEVLRRGLLEDVIGFGKVSESASDGTGGEVTMKKQCTYGDSRVDFELTRSVNEVGTKGNKEGATSSALIEVKNVVCADFSSVHAPEKTGKNHCVVIAPEEVNGTEYSRTALFPWGRVGQTFEGQKVVSARAIKHLRNLVDMGLKDSTVHPVVLFVVNRADCDAVRACDEACPVFARELSNAAKSGVSIVAIRVRWTEAGKAFFDGTVPVVNL